MPSFGHRTGRVHGRALGLRDAFFEPREAGVHPFDESTPHNGGFRSERTIPVRVLRGELLPRRDPIDDVSPIRRDRAFVVQPGPHRRPVMEQHAVHDRAVALWDFLFEPRESGVEATDAAPDRHARADSADDESSRSNFSRSRARTSDSTPGFRGAATNGPSLRSFSRRRAHSASSTAAIFSNASGVTSAASCAWLTDSSRARRRSIALTMSSPSALPARGVALQVHAARGTYSWFPGVSVLHRVASSAEPHNPAC